MLIILTEEVNHDFDGMSSQIDESIKHYLSNQFEVFHNDKILQDISRDLN